MELVTFNGHQGGDISSPLRTSSSCNIRMENKFIRVNMNDVILKHVSRGARKITRLYDYECETK